MAAWPASVRGPRSLPEETLARALADPRDHNISDAAGARAVNCAQIANNVGIHVDTIAAIPTGPHAARAAVARSGDAALAAPAKAEPNGLG
eukprot:5727081-Lingulodinium_polyedra.AAC.1